MPSSDRTLPLERLTKPVAEIWTPIQPLSASTLLQGQRDAIGCRTTDTGIGGFIPLPEVLGRLHSFTRVL